MCEAGLKAGLSQGQLDSMLELIKTTEIKEKLKQRTQEALDLGVSDGIETERTGLHSPAQRGGWVEFIMAMSC